MPPRIAPPTVPGLTSPAAAAPAAAAAAAAASARTFVALRTTAASSHGEDSHRRLDPRQRGAAPREVVPSAHGAVRVKGQGDLHLRCVARGTTTCGGDRTTTGCVCRLSSHGHEQPPDPPPLGSGDMNFFLPL